MDVILLTMKNEKNQCGYYAELLNIHIWHELATNTKAFGVEIMHLRQSKIANDKMFLFVHIE